MNKTLFNINIWSNLINSTGQAISISKSATVGRTQNKAKTIRSTRIAEYDKASRPILENSTSIDMTDDSVFNKVSISYNKGGTPTNKDIS